MLDIGNLEIHAWHGCNLVCESCSHYSSLGLKGGPDAKTCLSWMKAWSDRLRPRVFSILGGEPCANQQLVDIVANAVALWTNSEIRLVTNGFLLHRHPRLAEVLGDAKKAVLVISSHHPGAEYQKRLEPVRKLAAEWYEEHGINYRIVEADSFWTRRYHTTNEHIEFFNSDPKIAWHTCVGKFCPQIFDWKIWKCPPIAYLKLLKETRNVSETALQLTDYYKALTPDSCDEELIQFFDKKEEGICALCPENEDYFELPIPFKKIPVKEL